MLMMVFFDVLTFLIKDLFCFRYYHSEFFFQTAVCKNVRCFRKTIVQIKWARRDTVPILGSRDCETIDISYHLIDYNMMAIMLPND